MENQLIFSNVNCKINSRGAECFLLPIPSIKYRQKGIGDTPFRVPYFYQLE